MNDNNSTNNTDLEAQKELRGGDGGLASAIHCVTVALLLMAVLAAVIFATSFAGFTHPESALWTLLLASSIGVAFWGLFLLAAAYVLWTKKRRDLERFLAWTRNLSLAGLVGGIVTGIILGPLAATSCGPGLWFVLFYYIAGWIGSCLCLCVWCFLPRLVHSRMEGSFSQLEELKKSKHMRSVRWWVGALVSFGTLIVPFGVIWLGLWSFGGDHDGIDISRYPNASTSPYKLPYPKGESSFMMQGNGGKLSHYVPTDQYAFDFLRPCGTPVLAARSGVVDKIDDTHDGNTFTGNALNNYVYIRHEDGSIGGYYHIEKGSAVVQVGDTVLQGETIASVGNVGQSMGPHIHFGVEQPYGITIPVSFSDIASKDSGIPRSLHIYTSGNDEAVGSN